MIICAEGLVRISYVHCFVSVYLIHVPPMSVKKDEYLVFCSLTFLLNIYMNIHITHTIDIVTLSLFLRVGLFGSMSVTTNTLLIERSFCFSFSFIIHEEQTLIITKCMDMEPRFVQRDAHALAFMAISAFSG